MTRSNFSHSARRLYIKTFSWEYWPMWLVYLPASFYFLYLALKAKSFFFFNATNPTIENGGMLYESKWKIFQLIPKDLYPKTIYIEEHDSIEKIKLALIQSNLEYPIIAKPDIGARGLGVKKISNHQELEAYRRLVSVPFLVQAYVDYPVELSVFYYRNPKEEKGQISSVTVKELLNVTGNGTSSLDALIRENDRAFLQYEKLSRHPGINLQHILKQGEKKVLIPYGNHVLGAKFLDYNHIIDEQLTITIDQMSKRIEGFYFGRYDIRCSSIEDLKNGKNISILELNGSGAEPAHIYDPNFSYFKAQKVLINYFKNMYQSAEENHKMGIPYMSYKAFKRTRKLEKLHNQKLSQL